MIYDIGDDDIEEINDMEGQDEIPKKSNFIGIMFECCKIYGRIYKNKEGTAYLGRCPKCMRSIKIKVGQGGTNARFFRAQ